MTQEQKNFSFYLIIFLVITFIVGGGIMAYRGYKNELQYPYVTYEDSLKDTVSLTETNRGIIGIQLLNGKKYRFPFALNKNYEIENLCNAVVRGDLIIKKYHSDTIMVKRKDKTYIFISGITIPKETQSKR